MKPRFLIASAALAALVLPLAANQAIAQASNPWQPPRAEIGSWGVALENRDLSVKPGEDFEKHANGTWSAKTPIPADRASTGAALEVYERTQANLQKLITGGAGTQYGALYASFMDEKAVKAAGIKPLMADIAKLRAITSKRDFARFMGTTSGAFGASIVGPGVYADTANPELNVLWLSQGGLGLPEREYYLADQFKPQRNAYRAYIVRTLAKLGEKNPKAAADRIMAFETAIAEKSWVVADRRDIGKINNPMSTTELMAYAPGLEWAAFWQGAGIAPQARIIVMEKTAIRDISAIYANTPLETLKQWQAFHIADQASPYLDQAMVESRFAFRKTLSGVATILPRWKRAVQLVDGSFGELIGQDYVKKHFPPAAKAKMEALVDNLKLAMADRINGNAWMSPATKSAALEKLKRMDVMVGYPDKFRDYSGLRIEAGDLYGNVQRAGRFNNDYAMADLGKPVERKKWLMNPQEVNAYNGGLENKIVFPAGILQAPYFDLNADDAVNYGAIGAIIGHEITHGFDDQGRKIDASGAVRDWWVKEDAERFEAQAKIFGAQYAKFEAVPGAFINPELTMGENIADLAGLLVALDAYHKSLGGKPAPVLDGLTGDQRFFLAFAQSWRSKEREDAVRNQVTTDPHSPARFRVLGPVRNIEAWYAAFGVKPGDSMYIPPEKRAQIW
jgi:putative endopeptidase